MKQRALPLGVAAILAVAVSAAFAAAVFAAGQRIELGLALAALVLAAAHLVIFLYRDLYYRRRLAGLNELHLRDRKLAEQLAAVSTRVGVLEESRDEPPAPRVSETNDLNREFEQLRLSVKKLAEEYGGTSPKPPPRRDPEMPQRPDDRSQPAANHRLEFYLEPIVSLDDDSTVHYRASLVLEGQGQRVVFEELARQAAANGLRPDLDGHAVSRALAVGQRLAAKRPGTCVFVPVGLETLSAQDALSAIEWQMNKAGNAATSIVFEIDHAAMAALGPRGIEGLARLARHGAGMALSKAHGMGIDLHALRALHFRFISFSAAALPADGHSIPAWAHTARIADEYGLKIGVQGLFYDEQVNIASRWARLGSGPVFASPRRVKGEAVSIDQIRSAA
jgi:EAL domain-containing protein (putative c-di-GMP-specific phosphodiesterase class I)